MHIKSIYAKNLKGQDFTDLLEPLTLITGPNFSGKTSRLLAIRLAILGWDPSIGKTNQAIFALSSGGTLTVGAQLSDGRAYERIWSQGERGSVKSTGKEPGGPPLRDPHEPAVNPTLDSSAYFSGSAQDKLNCIFQLAKLDDETWSPKKILEDVVAQGAWSGLEKLRVESPSIQKQVAVWLEQVGEWWKEGNSEKRRCEGALLKVTELKLADADQTSLQIGSVRKLIDDLRQGANAAAAEIGSLTKDIELKTTQATNLKATIRNMEAEAAKIPSSRALKDQMKDCGGLVSFEDAVKQIDAAWAERDLLRLELETLKPTLKLHRETIAVTMDKLEALKDHATCPTCGAKAEDGLKKAVKELKATLKKSEAEEAALTKREKGLGDELSIAMKCVDVCLATKNDAEKRKQRLDALKAQAETVDAKLLEVASAIHAKAQELEALVKSIPSADRLNEMRASKEKLDQDLKVKDGQLSKLEATKRDLILLADTKTALEKAEEQMASCKAAGLYLKELREKLVSAAIDPMLETANAVFGVTGKLLAFNEGDIGYWNGAKFVPHEAFSGGETALAYVGFSAGLLRHAPPTSMRLIILDELGRFREDTKEQVLGALKTCLEGKLIDQAIVVDVSPVNYPLNIEGWKRIEMVEVFHSRVA